MSLSDSNQLCIKRNSIYSNYWDFYKLSTPFFSFRMEVFACFDPSKPLYADTLMHTQTAGSQFSLYQNISNNLERLLWSWGLDRCLGGKLFLPDRSGELSHDVHQGALHHNQRQILQQVHRQQVLWDKAITFNLWKRFVNWCKCFAIFVTCPLPHRVRGIADRKSNFLPEISEIFWKNYKIGVWKVENFLEKTQILRLIHH